MVIELRVVQFWSEIILLISNQTRAARSFDFEITRTISDQIALHSVQLPILTARVRNSGNIFQSMYFWRGFSCCPYQRGVHNSEVSAMRELTVFKFISSTSNVTGHKKRFAIESASHALTRLGLRNCCLNVD